LLTRDTDVFRAARGTHRARQTVFGADLFISNPCNPPERSGGSGVMTFVLDDSKKTKLAARIARSRTQPRTRSHQRAGPRHERDKAIQRSRERRALERICGPASALGHGVFFCRATRTCPDGGVKRAGFYVLAGARMPAVLFETSFHLERARRDPLQHG